MSTIASVPEVPVDAEAVAEATALADRFIASANELDPARRRDLIAATWSVDGHFIDPLFEATGHDELDHFFASVQAMFPGSSFRRIGNVDRMGRWMRASWDLHAGNGALLVTGTDTCEIGDDGRLVRIVSFYDRLESA